MDMNGRQLENIGAKELNFTCSCNTMKLCDESRGIRQCIRTVSLRRLVIKLDTGHIMPPDCGVSAD